jgi:hypothetical protein
VYGAAFGILSSIAVRKKNRDQGNWFLIGLFFGIFGLIAAILIDETGEPIQQVKFDPTIVTKKCPDCAETIRLEARVCRFCQYRFTDEDVAEQIAKAEIDHTAAKEKISHLGVEDVPKAEVSRWECPACHTMNHKYYDEYCFNCKHKQPM